MVLYKQYIKQGSKTEPDLYVKVKSIVCDFHLSLKADKPHWQKTIYTKAPDHTCTHTTFLFYISTK